MGQPKLSVLAGGLDASGGALPHSDQAEAAVLASILIDTTPSAWAIAQQCGVKPPAFFNPRNRVVCECIAELFSRGEAAVDVAMVQAELCASNRLDEAGGLDHLLAISSVVPTSAQVRHFSEIVKLLWDLRHCVALAGSLREKVAAFDGDREAWVQAVSGIGSRLITLGKRSALKLVADHVGDVADAVRKRAAGTVDKSGWLDSSLPTFNAKCKPYNSGLQDDGLVLVGGGSGTGKSVWLRQEAWAALKQGKAVVFISRETGTRGVMAMLAAAEVGVDLNNLDRELPERLVAYYAELDRIRTELADRRLFVIQQEPATPITYIEDVVELLRAHVHRYGVPAMVCVDYLQLFETRKRTPSREQTVAVVSHAIQAAQREYGCVFLIAAQLNEAGLAEMRLVRRDEQGKVIHRMPKPGDLRESQGMYHDADRVIFLYRPPVNCRDEDQTSPGVPKPEVWIYQEKRRSGGIFYVRTWFEKRYTRFVELTRAEQIESEGSQKSPFTAPAPSGPLSKADFKKQFERRP